MAEEKALEQLQQAQEDLTEQARLDRETARERANDHRRQLEEQNRQLEQQLAETNRSRNDELQRRDKDLETERAKIKEEREKADADTQKKTQEHQERIKTQSQEHKEHTERRYKEDENAAQEATKGRDELRDGAKEYNDRASADHARNVDAQKDDLTHMREQQKGQIDRKVEDMNQTKNRQIEEQTGTGQKIEAVTAESRATAIETLRFKIKSSMALIDAANIATKIDSHITTYDNTLARCITTGLTCIKESDKVKLQLSILILELEASSETCKNPTAADSKDGTSNQPLNEIEEMRNLVKNYCDKAMSSLDELQSICSNSISSLSTNPNLSEDLRKTYKSHLHQVGNAARNLYGAVYKTKSNMNSRSPLKITNLEKLDKELENGIKELNKELNDIPEAQGIDGLREQLKEKQAMDELARANAEVIEASKRSAADAERRAQDRRAQIDQQNRQLDDQRKKAENMRSGEIKNLENEMAVERQRAKDQQDRAEAERLRLANEYRDRMKGNTKEFNGQVKRIENADIRDAQEHKVLFLCSI
ncbi:hypothetical protein WR25_19355 [Diploscapter pachys]|uniref:Uncharacterized protein n=1 Tax=Diploscapter pachys TaxID=2018661 RepID=A0A2A2J0E6_9BILA|nr:hypothetical protein WR25_19355 [Diploscapter pachys]